MIRSVQCLDDDTVVAWLSGELAPDAADVVERHVDSCPTCRALLVALTEGPIDDAERKWKSMPWATGATIGGAYRILRVLGSGATCVVAAAEHIPAGKMVALKFMHPFSAGARATRFAREARAA